jgi:RNA polymerase sigma-70 factor (ECF subfamily)
LQALIAAEHVAAASDTSTDWNRVAALYERLEEIEPSPIVRLNRAIAVAEANGAAAAPPLLDGLDSRLSDSHQLAATRAELLLRLERTEAAVAAYDRALALQTNDVVRKHLSERRAEAVLRTTQTMVRCRSSALSREKRHGGGRT